MKKWWKDPIKKRIVSEKISLSLKGKSKNKKYDFKSVFKNKYIKNKSGCWLWIKCKNDGGYGRLNFKSKKWTAHRLSYFLSKGNILRDMCVCHTCDNPSCINPDHLFLGTNGENMLDMMKKGRGRISKLSEEDKINIVKLHSAGYSEEALTREFDTSLGVIKFILSKNP